jgi:pantothenate kinase type III
MNMDMLLIDAGNTRIKWATARDGALACQWTQRASGARAR